VVVVFLLLLIVAVLAVLLYLFVFVREVPEIAEERLGRLEDLPVDVGVWKPDTDSSEAQAARSEGLTREVRLWHDTGGGFGAGRLLRQARYRDGRGDIVRVDADQVVKRRRVRS
jgi:hypothetical protein